jgi:hypothetical protein
LDSWLQEANCGSVIDRLVSQTSVMYVKKGIKDQQAVTFEFFSFSLIVK